MFTILQRYCSNSVNHIFLYVRILASAGIEETPPQYDRIRAGWVALPVSYNLKSTP